MMEKKDFMVYSMPAMLSTKVWRPDPNDATKYIRDEGWYERQREQKFHLFSFLQAHGLTRRPLLKDFADVDGVILMFSDLTEEGQAFIMSQATERWLGSFDRPGTKKKPSDVRYLEKKLAELRAKRAGEGSTFH